MQRGIYSRLRPQASSQDANATSSPTPSTMTRLPSVGSNTQDTPVTAFSISNTFSYEERKTPQTPAQRASSPPAQSGSAASAPGPGISTPSPAAVNAVAAATTAPGGIYRLPSQQATLKLEQARDNPKCVILSHELSRGLMGKYIKDELLPPDATWESHNIVADFEMGKTTVGLVLPLLAHKRNEKGVLLRMAHVKGDYLHKLLIIINDMAEQQDEAIYLTRLGILCNTSGWTMVVAWSPEEAARYIRTFRKYLNHSVALIDDKLDTRRTGLFYANFETALLTIDGIQQRDVRHLLARFGSFAQLANADVEWLKECENFGPVKAQRLYDVFHKPFSFGKKKKAKGKRSAKNEVDTEIPPANSFASSTGAPEGLTTSAASSLPALLSVSAPSSSSSPSNEMPAGAGEPHTPTVVLDEATTSFGSNAP